MILIGSSQVIKAEYVPVVGNQDNTGNVKRYSDNKEFEIKGNGAGGVGGNGLIFRYYRLTACG